MTDDAFRPAELLRLGHYLQQTQYRFTAVTPDTHARILARKAPQELEARDLLGWNRPFLPSQIPQRLFELLLSAGAAEQLSDGHWRSTYRCATVDHLLFFHSAFPTRERDAVFFGPDSYRFVRALLHAVSDAERVVDVGCGSGVGGIVLARSRDLGAEVQLTDINPRAVQLAELNAQLNGARARVVIADLLETVTEPVDLVIANPPYLFDREHRLYRDGGSGLGSELSARIVREAAPCLRPRAGRLLMYSGAAVVHGEDQLLKALTPVLRETHARFSYAELDPDIFGTELDAPAYARVERIAAVLLDARF